MKMTMNPALLEMLPKTKNYLSTIRYNLEIKARILNKIAKVGDIRVLDDRQLSRLDKAMTNYTIKYLSEK